MFPWNTKWSFGQFFLLIVILELSYRVQANYNSYEGSLAYRQEAIDATDLPCGSAVEVKKDEKYAFDSKSAINYEASLYAAEAAENYNYEPSRRRRSTSSVDEKETEVKVEIIRNNQPHFKNTNPNNRLHNNRQQGLKRLRESNNAQSSSNTAESDQQTQEEDQQNEEIETQGRSGGGSRYGHRGGYEGHSYAGERYSGSGSYGYSYPAKPAVCEWTFTAADDCSLESHIIKFRPGVMNCYKQQFVISDNYTDFKMCGYQKLYPGFRAETPVLTIKYWKQPYTYRHVFKGYVTCVGRAQRPTFNYDSHQEYMYRPPSTPATVSNHNVHHHSHKLDKLLHTAEKPTETETIVVNVEENIKSGLKDVSVLMHPGHGTSSIIQELGLHSVSSSQKEDLQNGEIMEKISVHVEEDIKEEPEMFSAQQMQQMISMMKTMLASSKQTEAQSSSSFRTTNENVQEGQQESVDQTVVVVKEGVSAAEELAKLQHHHHSVFHQSPGTKSDHQEVKQEVVSVQVDEFKEASQPSATAQQLIQQMHADKELLNKATASETESQDKTLLVNVLRGHQQTQGETEKDVVEVEVEEVKETPIVKDVAFQTGNEEVVETVAVDVEEKKPFSEQHVQVHRETADTSSQASKISTNKLKSQTTRVVHPSVVTQTTAQSSASSFENYDPPPHDDKPYPETYDHTSTNVYDLDLLPSYGELSPENDNEPYPETYDQPSSAQTSPDTIEQHPQNIYDQQDTSRPSSPEMILVPYDKPSPPETYDQPSPDNYFYPPYQPYDSPPHIFNQPSVNHGQLFQQTQLPQATYFPENYNQPTYQTYNLPPHQTFDQLPQIPYGPPPMEALGKISYETYDQLPHQTYGYPPEIFGAPYTETHSFSTPQLPPYVPPTTLSTETVQSASVSSLPSYNAYTSLIQSYRSQSPNLSNFPSHPQPQLVSYPYNSIYSPSNQLNGAPSVLSKNEHAQNIIAGRSHEEGSGNSKRPSQTRKASPMPQSFPAPLVQVLPPVYNPVPYSMPAVAHYPIPSSYPSQYGSAGGGYIMTSQISCPYPSPYPCTTTYSPPQDNYVLTPQPTSPQQRLMAIPIVYGM